MKAGRGLDVLVAEMIFGWLVIDAAAGIGAPDHSGLSAIVTVPYYSTDIAAAWQVIERMTDHTRDDWCTFEMDRCTHWINPTWGYDVCFGRQNDYTRQPDRVTWAETAPMAICLATLKARGVEVRD